jgi:protein-tyrosine-phosphatase/DNA-binding transcriptional ArsR family regulator
MTVVVNAQLPGFLKLLAHELRWQLVAVLAQSDYRVQELVAKLQRPQNLLSYHLRLLREGQVVSERRSSADGRDIYYSLDLDHLRGLYLESGQGLHPALACLEEQVSTIEDAGSGRPYRVLFLCTHNSARSQLAEGILRANGGHRVEVFSAGSEPTAVHPLALRAAQAMNLDLSQHTSKSVNEFAGQPFNAIITVCDRVREVCPVFPDDPQQIHWSFADPTAVTGTEEEQYQAFLQTAQGLSTRINYWLQTLEHKQTT